jgi:hypothetical protein
MLIITKTKEPALDLHTQNTFQPELNDHMPQMG